MMKYIKTMVLMALFLTMIAGASAQRYANNPIYGVLPYEGVSYVRYPVYHSNQLGTSYSYGFNTDNYHTYISHRYYKTHPRYQYGVGWHGTSYRAVITHQHRPLLYPGIYRWNYW